MQMIDQRKALDAIEKCHKRCCRTDSNGDEWIHYETALNEIESIKPKCGHWMIEPTEEPEYCKCSECGYVNLIVEVFSLDGYHYCPNCGAKMERGDSE